MAGRRRPGRDRARQQCRALDRVGDGSGVDRWVGEYDPGHGLGGAHIIGANGAIAVGGYVALAGLWAAPISGASMNPVRSLAPDLVRRDVGATWIDVVGPVPGALIGVAFEWILKGKPTAAGATAAQGSLGVDDSTTPER